jgi:hypothetical protein
MFAAGSLIWFGRLGERRHENVAGITCIRPCEGWPFLAFESQLLIAAGLPPDSCRMMM